MKEIAEEITRDGDDDSAPLAAWVIRCWQRGPRIWPTRLVGPPPGLIPIAFFCWLLAALLVVPLWMQLKHGVAFDFVYVYGVGQILNHNPAPSIYDYHLQLKTFNAISALHKGAYGPSPYPPFVALFFSLFARLPFIEAYLVWMAISLALYWTGVTITLRDALPREGAKQALILCVALAFPAFVLSNLVNGQLASVAVASVAAAIALERRERWFAGGLVLSLMCYKPTLLVLVVPMLLLTRRFKMLAGFATGGAALAAAATAICGVRVWPAYVEIVRLIGQISRMGGNFELRRWQFVDFNSLSYAMRGGRSWAGLAVLGVVLTASLVWLVRLLWQSAAAGARPEKDLVWALTLTWTLLVNVYVPIYDTSLLAVGVVLTLGAMRALEWKRAAEWFGALGLGIFGVGWVTEAVARRFGLQPLTLAIALLGVAQNLALRNALRSSAAKRDAALPAA